MTLVDGRLDVGTHLPLLGGRYQYLSVLGEGVSAQVVLARDTYRAIDELVAIKIMKRNFASSGAKEVRALRWLQSVAPSAAIARLRGCFMFAGHVCLVLPRLYPSLLDVIVESAALDKAARVVQLRDVAFKLLATVAQIHAHGVVHADLKPENVLLTAPLGSTAAPDLHVVDFGACFSTTAVASSQLAFEAQTLPYRAPEMADALGEFPSHMQRGKQGEAAVSGAMHGIDMHRRAEADALPPDRPNFQPRQEPLSGWHERLSPLQLALARVHPQAGSLVAFLLTLDPAQRLSAAAALQHPFLDTVRPLRAILHAHTATGLGKPLLAGHMTPAIAPSAVVGGFGVGSASGVAVKMNGILAVPEEGNLEESQAHDAVRTLGIQSATHVRLSSPRVGIAEAAVAGESGKGATVRYPPTIDGNATDLNGGVAGKPRGVLAKKRVQTIHVSVDCLGLPQHPEACSSSRGSQQNREGNGEEPAPQSKPNDLPKVRGLHGWGGSDSVQIKHKDGGLRERLAARGSITRRGSNAGSVCITVNDNNAAGLNLKPLHVRQAGPSMAPAADNDRQGPKPAHKPDEQNGPQGAGAKLPERQKLAQPPKGGPSPHHKIRHAQSSTGQLQAGRARTDAEQIDAPRKVDNAKDHSKDRLGQQVPSSQDRALNAEAMEEEVQESRAEMGFTPGPKFEDLEWSEGLCFWRKRRPAKHCSTTESKSESESESESELGCVDQPPAEGSRVDQVELTLRNSNGALLKLPRVIDTQGTWWVSYELRRKLCESIPPYIFEHQCRKGTQRYATAAETHELHALQATPSTSPILVLHATAMSILRQNGAPQHTLDALAAAVQLPAAVQAEATLPAAGNCIADSASPPRRSADSACQASEAAKLGAERLVVDRHAAPMEMNGRPADPSKLAAEVLARQGVGGEPASAMIAQQAVSKQTPGWLLEHCPALRDSKPAEAAESPVGNLFGRKQLKRSKTKQSVPVGPAQVGKTIAASPVRRGAQELAEPDPFSFPKNEDELPANDAISLAKLPAVNNIQQRRQAAEEIAAGIANAELTLDQGKGKSLEAVMRLAATANQVAKLNKVRADCQVEAETVLPACGMGEQPIGAKLRDDVQGLGAAAVTTSRQTMSPDSTVKGATAAVQCKLTASDQRQKKEMAGASNTPGRAGEERARNKSSIQQMPATAMTTASGDYACAPLSSAPADAAQQQALSGGRKRRRKEASEQEGTPRPALSEDSADRRQREEDPPKAVQNTSGRKRQFGSCQSGLEAAAATPDGTWVNNQSRKGGAVAVHADSAGRTGRREKGRQENKKPWWVV